ncbi:hypothetical protein NW754_004213 [Fusarium falciforme]|nr:hypothetical protein NW754_004213 [Fusarium falciforme]
MGRRPRIPEEEWEKWKETIERIYMVKQQTLKLLIQGMANTHGFIATEKEEAQAQPPIEILTTLEREQPKPSHRADNG